LQFIKSYAVYVHESQFKVLLHISSPTHKPFLLKLWFYNLDKTCLPVKGMVKQLPQLIVISTGKRPMFRGGNGEISFR